MLCDKLICEHKEERFRMCNSPNYSICFYYDNETFNVNKIEDESVMTENLIQYIRKRYEK